MFLNINAEVDTKEIMIKMLETHTPHYILYLLAESYDYHDPEWFADKCNKILLEAEE